MQGATCFPSGWCDLSAEHAEVRRRLEELVHHALGGRGYPLTVIVAPYGSGKTTLLKHLEWYARTKLSVPAARVELRELVDFIVERRGVVHESELPGLVEEFAASKLGSREAVLLVDEVEESYDTLAAVVEHETSPLRGLADAAREGRLRTVVIMAFGPSSALKEALFGPVAWRARVVGLPLVGKAYVASLLRGIADGARLEPLANTVWWMARGRTAWALFVVENVAPRLAEALRRGPSALADLLANDPVFDSEVVDGVPLLDRSGLSGLADIMGSEAAAVAAALVGPAPVSVFEELAGSPLPPSVPVVYARAGVRVDDVVSQARRVMQRVARSIDAAPDAVERASSLLRTVLQAWSYRGVAPYDVNALKELFSIASDLAREVYLDEPQVHKLLESIDVVAVSLPAVELEEPLVALRPEVVVQLYPLPTSSPLVGCARHVSPDKLAEVLSGLSFEEVAEYSRRAAEAMGLGPLLSKLGLAGALLLPSVIAERHAGAAVCASLERPMAVFTRSPSRLLEVAEQLGTVVLVEATEKLDKFMAAALYNEAVGVESCSLARLEGRDRRGLQQFGELAKAMLIERASAGRRGELSALLDRMRSVARSLGPVGAALVSAVASARDPRALLDTLREAEKALADAEVRLRELLGVRPPPRPSVVEAASELHRLYERARQLGLDILEQALRDCRGAPTVQPLGAEQGLEAAQVVNELREAISAARSLELAWLPARLREAVGSVLGSAERLLNLLEGAEDPALRALLAMIAGPAVSSVRGLVAVLERGERTVGRIVEALAGLPEEVRSRVQEYVGEVLGGASNLVELEAAVSRLASELDDFESLVEEASSLARIRGERMGELLRLASELERLLAPEDAAAGGG